MTREELDVIRRRYDERQYAYDCAKEASGEPLSATGPEYHQDIGALLLHIDRLEREAKAGRELRANLVWSDFSRTHQAISTDVAMYDAAVTKETDSEVP